MNQLHHSATDVRLAKEHRLRELIAKHAAAHHSERSDGYDMTCALLEACIRCEFGIAALDNLCERIQDGIDRRLEGQDK